MEDNKWKKYTVDLNESLINAMKSINQGGVGMAIVIDSSEKLKGTLTDGDIRRGLLRGESVSSKVQKVMNPNPLVIKNENERDSVVLEALEKSIKYLPIIGEEGKILDIVEADKHQKRDLENPVIIMAGGSGSRLGNLTKNCPKPMLKIENKPILEIIITNLKNYGFKNFYLSVNYLSNVIESYFKDGSSFGVNIQYIREEKKLGTAGPLSIFKKEFYRSLSPVLVVNGDLLTKINFSNFLKFHDENSSIATMCIKNYEIQIPYGVIKVDQGNVVGVDEKPVRSFYVNAGAYIFSPEAFDYIPYNTYFDMNEFFNLFIQKNKKTSTYPVSEFWIDIGHQNDLKKAQIEFSKEFL